MQEYVAGTESSRTGLYAGASSGTPMSRELESPSVAMPLDGFSQHDVAQKMIDQ